MASPLNRMHDAATLMQKRGLVVKESSGWENRGRPYSFNPTKGVICHHTAAADDIDSVLINGRSDLPGPLCHYALHKNSDVVLIAAGYANHAGESKSGYPTNSTGWGIEATGPVPDNSAYGVSAFPNYDAYITMVGCIIEIEGWPSDIYHVPGHKDSCYPTGRKPDPHFDMNSFRKSVASGGGTGEDDLDATQAKQLKAIYDAMVVPGSTDPSQPYEDNYDRVKQIASALQYPGSTTPQQGFEIVARRVQKCEATLGQICEEMGIPFTPVDVSTITG